MLQDWRNLRVPLFRDIYDSMPPRLGARAIAPEPDSTPHATGPSVALIPRYQRIARWERALALVKAFLRAGVLSEDGISRETITGTPQGGILSPLLANIALSTLDEHFARKYEALGPVWTRSKHRRAGGPVMRLIRYADDFVVMVAGSRADAEALWDEVASVLAPMGLRLSVEKTRVCHIDEGFDFLGWRIQRQTWRSRTGKRAVYTYPSKKALASVMAKVRTLTQRRRHRTLADLLRQLNPVLRGWCNYFRHGVSSAHSAISITSPSGGSWAGCASGTWG